MDKYLMLFRNTPVSEDAYQNMTPEEMQASLDSWGAWVGGIAAQGKLIASDALDNQGTILSGSKKTISDGPYVEGKELVSGYLLVHAENHDDAVAIAQGCPIYEMEGSLEIRKLMVFE
jgi:hypothetical protein